MGRSFYWKLAFHNLRRNRRVYLPYLLSSIGIVVMFYVMTALGPSIQEHEMYGGRTVSTVMQFGSVVIGVFAVLFLFYTNSFLMKHRKRELGLYHILGMERRHIAKFLFRETILTSTVSIGLGLTLGIAFSKVMFLLLGEILTVEVPIAFTVPAGAVVTTAALFLTIFLSTTLYHIVQVRLAKPVELLHGGEAGEKEPKSHWFLSVLGALSLGAGYWLALTIQDPVEALAWFFIAVLLVIAGTYLLFLTGITVFLKLLRQNKNFYYQANHFTAVSGMLYRMKQNAAGLASICILFTCLLVTVSSTFALYTGIEGLIRVRYPRNVMIYARDANDRAREIIADTVADECKKAGLVPQNVHERTCTLLGVTRSGAKFSLSPSTVQENGEYCMLALYDQTEFHRFSGQEVYLGKDEVVLGDPRGILTDNRTVTVGENVFQIIRTDCEFEADLGGASVNNTFYLVFRDRDVIQETFQSMGDSSSENPVHHTRYTFGFDVDADRETVAALAHALKFRFGEDFPAEGAAFAALWSEDSGSDYQSFFALYGGLFFVGLLLGTLFLLGTALIIYYKQLSEGYEDARRFSIMQKVGMSRAEVKRSIRSQILTVFFLPLVTAVIHLAFAFPMLQKILALMNLTDVTRILLSNFGCVAVFGAVYTVIYLLTARTYYEIVETADQRG